MTLKEEERRLFIFDIGQVLGDGLLVLVDDGIFVLTNRYALVLNRWLLPDLSEKIFVRFARHQDLALGVVDAKTPTFDEAVEIYNKMLQFSEELPLHDKVVCVSQ